MPASLTDLEDAPTPVQVPVAKPDLSALEDAPAPDPTQVLSTSVSLGQDINPEKAARVKAAATALGVHTSLVAPALDQAEALVATRKFNAADYQASAPGVSQWLAQDPHHAAIARDDLKNLQDSETVVKNHDFLHSIFKDQAFEDAQNVYGALVNSVAGINHMLYRAALAPFIEAVTGPSEETMAQYRAGGGGLLGTANIWANSAKDIGMAGTIALNPTGAAGATGLVALPAAMQITGFDRYVAGLAKTMAGDNPGFLRDLASGLLGESPTIAMLGIGLVEGAGPGKPAFEGSRDVNAMFKASVSQDLYDRLGELKADSKTAQRSPIAHQEALQAAIGDRTVSMPLEAFEKALNDHGVEPAELIGSMGEDKAFQDAKQTGVFEVPLSKWLANTDPEVYKALSKEVSLGDAPSVKEASIETPAPETAVLENLIKSGMTEEQAKPVAALWGGAYKGLGEIAGMTPDEVASKFTPTINASLVTPPDLIQAKGNESGSNGFSADSKFLSDVIESKTFKSKGLGDLDIKAQKSVVSRVVSAIGDSEIRRGIISSIPVDVMNDVVKSKFTPDEFFSDKAMLADSLSSNPDAAVKLSSGAKRGLIESVARLVAERVLGSENLTGEPSKGLPAPGAVSGHEQNPTLQTGELQSDRTHNQGDSKNPRGSFEPGRFNINLFKDANLSTVLHESGHAFLDMTSKLAADPKATPELKAYWKTIKDHLGIEEAPNRKQAETWAKDFEKYLRDGEAPSPKLATAFGKFRDWLVEVYKNVKKQLGDKVSPELKQVFDQMLATKAERGENPFNFEPLKDDKSTAKEIRQQYTEIRNERIVKGNQLSDELKRLVPDKAEREGMFWYKAAEGDKEMLEHYLTDESLAPYHEQIKAALNLSPEAIKALAKVDRYYDQAGQAALNAGTVQSLRENYQNRIYSPEPPKDFVKTEVRQGLKQSTGHSKQRVYDTEFEAAQAGKKFATTDIADSLAIHNEEMARVNTAREMADHMAETGLGGWMAPGRTPDGWKQVGTLEKHVPINDAKGNAFVLPMRFMAPEGIADGLKAIADIDFTKRIDSLRGIQKWQGLVKTVDLSLSFFHHMAMLSQSVYQRDIKTLLNLKNMNQFLEHPDFAASEQDFAGHGGITAKLADNQDVLRDLSKKEGWGDLPGFKQYLSLVDKNSNFLFGKLQRFLKVSNYANEVAAWVGDHPEASNDEVLTAKRGIAKHVNSVFGGLNWEAMGMTKSNLSLMRLVLLAPDWTVSNFQLLSQATNFGNVEGGMSRAHIASALLIGMAATEGLNHLLTGHFTDKNKPGHKLEVEIRPDVYVSLLRGGIGDITKAASMIQESGAGGVSRFAQGKLAPFARTAVGLLANKQYTGAPIVPKNAGAAKGTYDVLKFAAQNALPIPLGASNTVDYLKRGEKPDAVGAATVASGVGRFSKK